MLNSPHPLHVASSYFAAINDVSAMSNSDVNITSNFQRNFYSIDAYFYDAIFRKCAGFSPRDGGGGLFDDGGGAMP